MNIKDLFSSGSFPFGVELITTRGPFKADTDRRFEKVEEFLSLARVKWVSVTDNPSGYPMVTPETVARIINGRKETMIHMSCRDRNRAALESAAWEYSTDGFENILAITGDYPRNSFAGTANPVFDLDSTGLIYLLNEMNSGLRVRRGEKESKFLPTSFYIGCVVSPFKSLGAEVRGQYFKLLRKAQCGAGFVFPQFGFDMRKAVEPKLFLEARGLHLPFVANVYLLRPALVRIIRANALPGCVMSDDLFALCGRYSGGPDKGQAFFRELAAKQMAAYRALGFCSGYLGGASSAAEADEILAMSEKFTDEDGRQFATGLEYPMPGEFYMFDRNAVATSADPVLPAVATCPSLKCFVSPEYCLSRIVDRMVFMPGSIVNRFLIWFYSRVAVRPGLIYRAAHFVERAFKAALYRCRDCGDCSLPDCGFICPISACVKNQRNGPCGGSRLGLCELSDRPCMWVAAYERLAFWGEVEAKLTGSPVIQDASLAGTSAWANAILRRDHNGPKKLG